MALTLSYQEMLAEIIRQDQAKTDLIADTRRMSAAVRPLEMSRPRVHDGNAPNRVLVDIDRPDQELATFALNDHAAGQISNDLGIPKRYFDRMLGTAPSLLEANVNHWLGSEPNRRMLRGFKPSNDDGIGTGRAWLSDKYKRLDNIEIARKIFPIFEQIDGLEFHQAALTDQRFYLRAVLPKVEAEIKVGDVVQAGIEIRNSEVGSGQLVVQPFIWRLICLNGMVVPDYGTSRRHVGKRITDENETDFSDETLRADDTAFWLAIRDTAASILTQVRFDEIARRLGEIVHGDKITAPVAATEELQQRYSLSDTERETLLTNLVADGDLSQWGALNALTATAKGAESFDRQAELEGLGWAVAQLTPKEWASIAVAA